MHFASFNPFLLLLLLLLARTTLSVKIELKYEHWPWIEIHKPGSGCPRDGSAILVEKTLLKWVGSNDQENDFVVQKPVEADIKIHWGVKTFRRRWLAFGTAEERVKFFCQEGTPCWGVMPVSVLHEQWCYGNSTGEMHGEFDRVVTSELVESPAKLFQLEPAHM